MANFCTQYGNYFFVIKKISGYTGNRVIFATKITDNEYKKLFYSGEREVISVGKRFNEIRIKGNAKEILGKDIYTINAK